jgi:histidine phosphotransferase ChpT
MTQQVDLRVLELLAAKLCHDLIGPVSAIANGVELLGEDDPDFVRDAVALVDESARKANRRLQFYRFAYGFGGGGLTGPPPHQLVAEFFAETAITCDYATVVRDMPLPWQKLACVMLALAADGLPRGGRLRLQAGAGGSGAEVAAAGEGTGLSPEARSALNPRAPVSELTTRTVGAHLAGLFAAGLDCRLTIADRPDGFILAATAM